MKFKIATLAAIGTRQDTRHLAPKISIRRLISIAAGVAMALALLVCHGAWPAEAMGLHHAGTAPHHHDGTPGLDDSADTELGADCHLAAVVNGSASALAGPSVVGVVHEGMPVTQRSEVGFLLAAFNSAPPLAPPTLVQQHVLIRI